MSAGNVLSETQKLERLLSFWVHHNEHHLLEHGKWKEKAKAGGLRAVAGELDRAIALAKEANEHLERARKVITQEKGSPAVAPSGTEKEPERMQATQMDQRQEEEVPFRPIGVIRTPYVDRAPFQPLADDAGEFRLCVHARYAKGLADLDRFRYIYVLFFIHRIGRQPSMSVKPPWAQGKAVGLFSSRSPVRPNPLGLSIVEVKRIADNEVFTSGLDAFDGTPLLDIKPYIKDLDSKDDANYGWLEDLEDREHLTLHLKGVPHDY